MDHERYDPSFVLDNEPSVAAPALQAFLETLQARQHLILPQAEHFLRRPAKSAQEAALAIYVDATLKSAVFGSDPCLSPTNREEHQANREAIAFTAARLVAGYWLQRDPGSRAAREVMRLGTYAPLLSQRILLYKMWPTIEGLIAEI